MTVQLRLPPQYFMSEDLRNFAKILISRTKCNLGTGVHATSPIECLDLIFEKLESQRLMQEKIIARTRYRFGVQTPKNLNECIDFLFAEIEKRDKLLVQTIIQMDNHGIEPIFELGKTLQSKVIERKHMLFLDEPVVATIGENG